MTERDQRIRVRHMLDHAREAIALLGDTDLASLRADRTLELALTRLVEIVGEAAYRIPEAVRATIPGIPWWEVVGMRHRLVHGYDRLSTDVLWGTIRRDLPELVCALAAYLDNDEA